MTTVTSDLAVLARAPQAADAVPPPKSRWKTRVLLPGVILAVFAGLLVWAARDVLLPGVPVRVVPVVVKTTAQATGTAMFQAPGWIEADPYITNVTVLADGVVKDVLVLEGAAVKAGQEIVRMVDDDARLALDRAAADLKKAKASHEAAKREWEHPVERERVVAVAEAALAEVDAEAKKLDSEIAVESARVGELAEQLRREEMAGVGEAIPEYQVVRTRLQLKTQQAALEATRSRRPVLEAKRREVQAQLHAARENLRLRIPERRALDETAAALARAKVVRDEADLRLSRMVVKAPVDGIVLRRFVEPGTKLMLGMDTKTSGHAVWLYDPKNLQVRVDVPLADAGNVSVGQKAEVTVEVLPDRTFNGNVTRITHEADIQKNTLQVKVRIDEPLPELKPEMLARVKFLAVAKEGASSTEKARVFAPEKLLSRTDKGRAKAWVVDPARGMAVRREVTTGPGKMNGWVEIVDGLAPGDRLIADAPATLEDGDRIAIGGEVREP